MLLLTLVIFSTHQVSTEDSSSASRSRYRAIHPNQRIVNINRPPRVLVPKRPPDESDTLLVECLSQHRTMAETCLDIYGTCYDNSLHVTVHLAAHSTLSTPSLPAGLGIFWGLHSLNSVSETTRPSVSHTRSPLSYHSLPLAVPHTLNTYTTSKEAMRTFVDWAHELQYKTLVSSEL